MNDQSHDPVPVYEGPTPLADMLRDSLSEHGIASIQRAVGPFLGVIGDAARTPFSMVLVSSADWRDRRPEVEDCVALVLPDSLVEEVSDDTGDRDAS